MFLLPYIINPLLAVVSLFTATGVVLHDTQLDKATVTAFNSSAVVTNDAGLATFQKGDPHTHTDRASLAESLRSLKSANPRMQPRRDDERSNLNGERYFKRASGMNSLDQTEDYLS
ncbi:hypothetical protein B7Z17_02750 [Candidatus Saccharibacteria bacterium 32-49-10]|nr:MAG: hypothetical protein B7Z17_02750 [Candidatus Saccharibacteria bacterium 32-49-10]